MEHPSNKAKELLASYAKERELLNQSLTLAVQFLTLKCEEAKTKEKPTHFAKFLSSNLCTTLLTVLVGTLGGAIIANFVQEKSKSISERQQVVDQAFMASAKTVAAAQDVIDISSSSWDEKRHGLTGDDRKQISDLKRGVWKSYNSAIADWRVQRERIGYLLLAKGVPKQQKAEAAKTWDSMVTAVEHFTECAVRYNNESSASPEVDEVVRNACSPSRSDVRKELQALAILTAGETASPSSQGEADLTASDHP